MTPRQKQISQKKRIRELLNSIAETTINFSIDELELLLDYIKKEKWRE